MLLYVTLDNNVGATLRIDLALHPGHEILFAQTVASYLTNDAKATSMVFALYSGAKCDPGQPKPHAATMAELTGVLAENKITIRDGIFVGNDTYSPYDTDPGEDITLPISTTEFSQVNAEFIYRGSAIEPTNKNTMPPRTQAAHEATVVENQMTGITALHPQKAFLQAHELWTHMLESNDYPAENDTIALIAFFQFPHIRDQLMADIPASANHHNTSSSPKLTRHPDGHASSGPNNCSCTRTPEPAPNARPPFSPPSATSTGGKAEAPKHTNTSNSPSTPTPATALPD
ncbi:DUF4192 family protein [Paenarthrobacter sp. NPDC057981]|uniref:DUF4192 family protein n=1 Tax=Paenarthrobacter sp. NPDC057981 TaxID=3346297 RepID=UPI0036DE5E0E